MGYNPITDQTRQVLVKRYVTTLRSVLVGGSTPREQEMKLGYTPGSLAAGYRLLILSASERILPGDFELRGYTHLMDGKARGETRDVHQNFTTRLSGNSIDRDNRDRILENVRMRLNRGGLDRIAKIYPLPGTEIRYRPGSGVLQYKLMKCKQFDVIGKVLPGQYLKRVANGEITVADSPG